ncbi:zinc-binding dehydrogenase [Raoultibacter phocaeensis]|uniref:zinc-binding dehydrogenase n=1 Tax=Raoultibacter phocaeensis TaxID=2479841 RepID=UPI00210526F9|nr:zinc-binding dehydrogenase [Raoultibacter phocaeensis]
MLVRPTHLSICNADQRYYQGTRSEKVLASKLPMALIHEGIGTVLRDDSGTYKRGDCVVMLPNNPHETDPLIAENYLRSSEFCGSGYDGFMQECVGLAPDRVVPLPESLSKNVAAFTELVSVAVHSITRFGLFSHARRDAIGVWGDGNMGFIVSLILSVMYPNARIIVFGRNGFKLEDFTFVDETYLVHDIPSDTHVDHAFECCGGEGSSQAIDQIIDRINPEGTVSLLGVSEGPIPVNTRMVLEKGLKMFGSSRSGRKDFLETVKLYQAHPTMMNYLEALVGQVKPVSAISDIATAFEADIRKTMGKTIMLWNL